MFNLENIKKVRIENSKTQSDVAKILGVTRSSYAMWESNYNIFPIKRLIDFCNIFDVTIDYVFNFSDIKQNKKIIKEIDLIKVGERLKNFRKDNNLTQKEIASFLNIDQPTWSIYEAGKSLIGTPFLYMICSKYNISADYLLGRTNEPKNINIKKESC